MTFVKDKLPYFFFFIWILALLPKIIQLFLLVCWCLYLFLSKREKMLTSKISRGEIALAIYCVWYLLSITFNAPKAQTTRVFASVNTISVWFISLFIYFAYRNMRIDKLFLSKVALMDMLIMDILSMIYLSIPSLNFHFLNREFIGSDWLNGVRTTRFFCFFEYSNLVAIFCLILFPLSLLSVVEYHSRLLGYIYCILSLLPIYASASRSGIILGCIMVLNGILYIRASLPRRRISNGIIVSIICFLFLSCFILFAKIFISKFDFIFNSRSGSNNERFSMYRYSIIKMLDESPLIGCGIKETIPQFGEYIPLGSHSTYIGVLFKTGVVGFILFFTALLLIIKLIMANNGFSPYLYIFIAILIVYFVFEDIDGANWLLALLFGVAGCLSGNIVENRYGRVSCCR